MNTELPGGPFLLPVVFQDLHSVSLVRESVRPEGVATLVVGGLYFPLHGDIHTEYPGDPVNE